MKKQTSIYLSEKDQKRLGKIKQVLEADSNNEIIKLLIKEEYDRVVKYTNLVE